MQKPWQPTRHTEKEREVWRGPRRGETRLMNLREWYVFATNEYLTWMCNQCPLAAICGVKEARIVCLINKWCICHVSVELIVVHWSRCQSNWNCEWPSTLRTILDFNRLINAYRPAALQSFRTIVLLPGYTRNWTF